MEKFSKYLYADVLKKEKEFKKSMTEFIRQTCRMDNFSVELGAHPLLLEDYSVQRVVWNLNDKILYVDAVRSDTHVCDRLIIQSGISDMCELTTFDLYQLCEHLTIVLAT